MKLVSSLRSCFGRASCAGLVALSLATAATPQARAEEAAPSRLHALINVEFSNKYLTPRGMIVQDQGLTTQTLFLGFLNVYNGKPEDAVNSVTLVGGFWNDYATKGIPESSTPGGPTTNFVEIDPIFGVSLSLANNFKLDITYTAFCMQILSIGTSEHLETKLSYDDSKVLGAFALHPYLLYWNELHNKATAATSPSSQYFEIGVTPGTKLGDVKLEAPLRILLPDTNFYGEKYASASTVGLYELGLKASLPLKSMPKGYGFWDAHVGFRYVKFVDKNLQAMAKGGGFGTPVKDTTQIYAGVSVFF